MRYIKSLWISSIVFVKKSELSMPVGRVKARSPLGHSGHRRLQLVVGSNEIEYGKPHIIGRFKILLKENEEKTFAAFHNLLKDNFESIFFES